MKSRASRRAKFTIGECLEVRSLLSGFIPSAIEELFLVELNDARFNPTAYGVSRTLDVWKVAPSQPLALNNLLVQAARQHSQDVIDRNYFAHVSPEGLSPGDRISATGFVIGGGWSESIDSIFNFNPAGILNDSTFAANIADPARSDLIIDRNVPDLGHRLMLLDIGGQLRGFHQVGVGVAYQELVDSQGFVTRKTLTSIAIRTMLDSPILLSTTSKGD